MTEHDVVIDSTDSRPLLKRLAGHNSGVAMVEFAFTAPIMLTLGLSGLETANLAVGHLQVSQIAMLVADNASRVRESIDEADIREIFTGADLTGEAIDFSPNARIILSNLEDNGRLGADNGQWIRWQRCYGGRDVDSRYGEEGDGQTDDELADGVGPVGNRIVAPPSTAINFVEAEYRYRPVVSERIFGPIIIRYESAFVARERNDHALKNASAIPASDLWTCEKLATLAAL
jgi:hypothetical protein